MVNVLGLLAVGCCGLFAGAALYINVVEHPARTSCGVEIALRQWAPSYKRAAIMQASLALVGGVAGVLRWALVGGLGYLGGAFLLLAVVPFTLLVVSPTNKRLLDLHAKGEVGDAHELLRRWNGLHAVRSGLSVAALGFMLSGLR
jgi:anthrone oxygenase-like protein